MSGINIWKSTAQPKELTYYDVALSFLFPFVWWVVQLHVDYYNKEGKEERKKTSLNKKNVNIIIQQVLGLNRISSRLYNINENSHRMMMDIKSCMPSRRLEHFPHLKLAPPTHTYDQTKGCVRFQSNLFAVFLLVENKNERDGCSQSWRLYDRTADFGMLWKMNNNNNNKTWDAFVATSSFRFFCFDNHETFRLEPASYIHR